MSPDLSDLYPCTYCNGNGVDPDYGDDCSRCEGTGIDPDNYEGESK